MRLHPALLALLLPVAVAAQSDEWVRDDMSDDSLWLLKTSNLKAEKPNSNLLPGSIGGAGQWVMSQGDGPAYVVYFIPGRIEEVEIDTHRLTGASGDFSLAVSTDGKLYQPIDTGSVTLDSAFGWDYRLMSAENIPTDATHLLVRFPDGSSAHRLSEVWIKYQWDDALASRFLPSPAVEVAPTSTSDNYGNQSDAELEAMLRQLQNVAPAKDPATVRANLPGNNSSAAATNSPLGTSAEPDAPVSVSVNLPVQSTQTPDSNQPITFKFAETESANTSTAPSSEEVEKRKKPESTANENSPKIELHFDNATSPAPDEKSPEKSDSASGTSDEKPEVVWVLPTFTLPVLASGSGEKQSERPAEPPTGNLQIKIDAGDSDPTNPEAPASSTADDKLDSISVSSLALDGSASASAAEIGAGERSSEPSEAEPVEVRVQLPTAEVVNGESANKAMSFESPAVVEAAGVGELSVSVSKDDELATASATDESRPTLTFVRRGPRSKSHAFFSSRR